jgi:hypothetical protein
MDNNITHRNLLWGRIASINARINQVNRLLDSVEETIREMPDLSEFVTKDATEAVYEDILDKIAAIELTPGPAGVAGPKGETGEQGPPGFRSSFLTYFSSRLGKVIF